MARSVARQAAMQLLYEQTAGGMADDDSLTLAYELLASGNLCAETCPTTDDRAYIDDVLAGVSLHRTELDSLIETHSSGDWALERLPRVDLSILRLSVYELCYRADVPANVSVSEAMELAGRYSEPKSGRYINGVLGAIAREKRKD
ncbi:MAG TPA: transcription antitermination factor NusB [Candidatus Limiplasma sp.]|nr:transcription antitermination factor NusB [Candidatus Limiplasma sp.]